MQYRHLMVAALLWAAVTPQVPAQPGAAPPPRDSIILRCQDCGVIQSIRETQQRRSPATSNVGSAVPASNIGGDMPVGLVLYIPAGPRSREDTPYVGPVGSREWQNVATTTTYEFTVRMDDGAFRFAQRDGVSDLQVGDRVQLVGGKIERIGK